MIAKVQEHGSIYPLEGQSTHCYIFFWNIIWKYSKFKRILFDTVIILTSIYHSEIIMEVYKYFSYQTITALLKMIKRILTTYLSNIISQIHCWIHLRIQYGAFNTVREYRVVIKTAIHLPNFI